jgi:SAM-dependent methyltransferase
MVGDIVSRNRDDKKEGSRLDTLDTHAKNDHGIVRKFVHSLQIHGPLGTFKDVNEFTHRHLGRLYNSFFVSIDKLLLFISHYLDSQFDRKYGTDTSGVIDLKDLTIMAKNVENLWYEPMTEIIFRQIMKQININFGDFDFIDFGSGKGRVLLLASDYGFNKIIGIEFAQELHLIATRNVEIFTDRTNRSSNIKSICIDATEFNIPIAPLVIFFYCPFFGKVFERVLNNITSSLATNPREIVIIFYGSRNDNIKMLKETKFHWRELTLRPDWSRFKLYRCFLLTSSGK